MGHFNSGHYTTDFGGVIITPIITPAIGELEIIDQEETLLAIIEPDDLTLEIICGC